MRFNEVIKVTEKNIAQLQQEVQKDNLMNNVRLKIGDVVEKVEGDQDSNIRWQIKLYSNTKTMASVKVNTNDYILKQLSKFDSDYRGFITSVGISIFIDRISIGYINLGLVKSTNGLFIGTALDTNLKPLGDITSHQLQDEVVKQFKNFLIENGIDSEVTYRSVGNSKWKKRLQSEKNENQNN